MIQSVLVANRGEVAVRIIRACRTLGIKPIAIFSEADTGALWTRLADEAHCIGPASARESYLNIARIVEAAKACGVQAVHPGYGLLSESAEFARAVEEAGLGFVGPSPDTIALMGDKVTARAAARRSGLAVLAGSDGPVAGCDEALALAETIGYPIAVKASFGGGGRGLRVVREKDELAEALEQAGRESLAAFGRAEVFLERFLDRPRHVEVQILGDEHGNVVHLGDRDCSVQRRYQKLLEEAPAPGLPTGMADRIRDAAVKLCQDVSYVGAGTVEFLADVRTGDFFFLEMNTRLQVEHGVTELVTGVDIVEEQLRIANGEPISFTQNDVKIQGHAIQARITAEDPWDDFRPTPGLVTRLTLPLGPWLRLDFGIESGDPVVPHYDSMFGKIQAWADTRDRACRRLDLALAAFSAQGVPTSAPYLRSILVSPTFLDILHHTGSLASEWQPDSSGRPEVATSSQDVGPPAAEPRVVERVVSVPWGGRFVDISIFARASGENSDAAQGAPRDRVQSGHSGATKARAGNQVVAPMDAVVMAIACNPGDIVHRGKSLLQLEAMKMEVVVPAAFDCRVETVEVKAGAMVKSGEVLVNVAPYDSADE